MREGRLEFFVEPFTEGRPGPHVSAALQAVKDLGLEVEVGAFSNITTGEAELLVKAAGAMLRDALHSGATRVSIQFSNGDQPQIGGAPLHNALSRMIEAVEEVMGAPMPELSRHEKQAAVRMLDDQGAFLLRRSIEEVAGAMGVSRITIYNYLNAIRSDE